VVRHARKSVNYVFFSVVRNEADGNADEGGVIDGVTIRLWFDRLGIHEEGACVHLLLCLIRPAAQGMINKSEFVRCMNRLGYSFPIPSLKSLS
jgi:hypothetical protein